MFQTLNPWQVSHSWAVKMQEQLARRLIIKAKPNKIRVIAGTDFAYDKTNKGGFCSVDFFLTSQK